MPSGKDVPCSGALGGVRTLLPNEVMDGRMALERKGHTEPQRVFRSKEMEAVQAKAV